MEHRLNHCPICKNDLKDQSVRTEDYGNIHHIYCQYCGKYQLFGWRVNSKYGLGKSHNSARKTADPILSIAIRMEYEKIKKEVYIDHETIPELKKTVIEPENPLEKVDLLLIYLHKRNHDITKDFVIPVYDYPLIYARSVLELDTILQFGVELKFIQLQVSDNQTLRKCKLTEKGWKKIGAITNKNKEQMINKYSGKLSRGLKCFIVHGQDTYRRNELKKYLIELGITPIILHEQPSRGDTVTEKFEYFAETVDFAICLWTGDDQGCKKGDNVLNNRARQNVMLETGYFWSKLKRKKLIILHSNDAEIPSDLNGVIRITWNYKTWRDEIRKEIENMV